jgi:anti-anti-sigma factor
MDIAKHQAGNHLELTITGRLDAQWADRLSRELADAIRGGARKFRLDLEGVDFMSSAGLRVLLQYYKQVKGMQGSLVVSKTSPPVQTVIALAGFEELLGLKRAPSPQIAQPAAPSSDTGRVGVLERGTATLEVLEAAPYESLSCRALGDPEVLKNASPRKDQCGTMHFPDGTLAVGLGAFGHDFQDCQGRFGKLVAAAGAVAYQPASGTTVPDYQVQTGAFLPDAQVLYCLTCEGRFSHHIRFEAKAPAVTIPIAELVESCLAVTRTELVGLVMIAKTNARSVNLVVGVAAGADRPALEHLLRPLGKHAWPTGYLYAAAFPDHPLQKSELDLRSTVSALFDGQPVQRILQLGSDAMGSAELTQSQFFRGACWIGPIFEVAVERAVA